MNLIHEKTEVLLKSFLEQIKPKRQSWRLISIEFQTCDALHSSLFQNLCLKNLQLSFIKSDCTIFWHKPNFVLIFFQGRAMPVEKCVESFLKETEFRGFGRFFDILDLSVDWDDMKNMIQKIIIPRKMEEERKTSIIQISKPNVLDTFKIEMDLDKLKENFEVRELRVRPLILLVEDDPFTLQLVKLALKGDFDIITAETVRQALVYYQRHLPNMVFLDIQLPDGNGLDLLKKMSKSDSNSHIVMLSSHSQKEKILDCISNGAKGFIAKPFTKQRLVDATDKFMTSRIQSPSGNNRHGT